MPAIIPAVAAAAVAAIGGAGIAGILKVFVVNLVIGAVAQSLNEQEEATPSISTEPQKRQLNVRSAVDPHRIILGETVVGGQLVFARNLDGYLHLVLLHACHECEEIVDYFFDDVRLGPISNSNFNPISGKYAGKLAVRKHLGAPDQTVDSSLKFNFAAWTDDHRLRGRCYTYFQIPRDDDTFATGLPQIRAVIRGAKFYDPRDGVTRWSSNWALAVRHYLTSQYGLSAPASEILDDMIITAANIADERVPVASYESSAVSVDTLLDDALLFAKKDMRIHSGDGVQIVAKTGGVLPGGLTAGTTYYVRRHGLRFWLCASWADYLANNYINITSPGSGTRVLSHIDQARYSVNGSIDTSSDWREVMQALVDAGAGTYVNRQGKHALYAGAYVTPSTVIGTDDLRAMPIVRARRPRQELINGVRGTYVDPYKSYSPTDFAPVISTVYRTQDNERELWGTMNLPLIDNEARAQRVAKIMLERNRRQVSAQYPLMLTGQSLKLTPGTTVQVTDAELGWTARTFRVETWGPSEDGGVDLLLSEEDANIYAWSADEASYSATLDETELPDPFVCLPPASVTVDSGTAQLLIGGDGTVSTRVLVSWTPQDDPYRSGWEIDYRLLTDTVASPIHSLEDSPAVSSTYLTGPQDTYAYIFRVRAFNSIGVRSSWFSIGHVVLGKYAPPSDVSGFLANPGEGGVTFAWDAISDLDADLYEIRQGESWQAGIFVLSTRAQAASIGYVAPGSYTWRLKAIDRSGNYSSSDATAAVVVAAPGTPVLAANIAGADYELTWSASSGSFPVDRYEIRHGASYATGAFVGSVDATRFKAPVGWSGARTFWIAAIDKGGNAGVAGSIALTINVPVAPVASGSFIGPDYFLQWTIPAATLPIEQYEIRYGADWATGISVGKVKATVFRAKAVWSGARTFFVAAIDSAGNVGAAGSVLLNVTNPVAVTIVAKVANNQVGLIWSEGAGSLPVEKYELRRGDVFASANSLGYITARFANLFELVGADYTYWIVAYDTAGNQGLEAAASVTVADPPGLTIYESINSDFSGTLTNASITRGGDVLFPHDISKTWHQKFVDGGWASIAAKNAAGYDYWVEPSTATGYYEEQIDHGSVLASGSIAANVTSQTVDGTPAISCTLSYKQNVGDAWTDVSGFDASFTNARYFKVRVTCASTGGDDLASMDILQWTVTG